jgi:nitrous oxidase accessory protein
MFELRINFMRLRSKIFLLVITLFYMAAVPMSAIAADVYVDDNGNDTTGDGTSIIPWKTIGYAVSQASDGDTIILRDGTYTENIEIDKQLTIRSENGAILAIVTAADPNENVLFITADKVTIDGLTISGATEVQMAGIYLYSSDNSSILNNICSGNYNGVYLYYSDNATVSNNTCSDNTNGIYLYRSEDVTISDNNCDTNDYGILIEGSSRIAINGNTCSENGVGIRVLPSEDVTISNNTCENNDYGLYISYYTGYNADDFNDLIAGNTLENNNVGQYYFEDISGTQGSSSDSTCFIKSARCL